MEVLKAEGAPRRGGKAGGGGGGGGRGVVIVASQVNADLLAITA